MFCTDSIGPAALGPVQEVKSGTDPSKGGVGPETNIESMWVFNLKRNLR